MIQLRLPHSHDYTALPDIDATDAGLLTADDFACLADIGRCLVEQRANHRFGVTLLHSHFPIQEDEILLEETQLDRQTVTLRPTKGARQGLAATSLCFDAATAGLVGLEYVPARSLGSTPPLNDADAGVLGHVRAILQERAMLGRFGIRLLHDALGLQDRVLLETCDTASRLLTCTTTVEGDPAFVDAIPTLFQWDLAPTNNGPITSQGCMQFCKNMRKCVRSRDGHESGGTSHESSHDDRF